MSRTRLAFADAIPPPPESSILSFAEKYVKLVGSARSEGFDRNTAPWLNEPLECQADEQTRRTTLVKPVQCGGSTAGEIALQYWLRFYTGFVQYNWPTDKKAELRWLSRFEMILKACQGLEWPERFKSNKCQVQFARNFFIMQGVWVPDNLDSDAVKLQVNEEVHEWQPGHLAKAYNRTTAFSWLCKIFNISNAGKIGDQLHQAYKSGTQQQWVVKCPGCHQFHAMRTRWEDERPDLGGLRYDSAACKRTDGSYDYNRLKSTLRFQMPCGYIVHEDARERRELSLSGKYAEPENTGADTSERSYTLEGVAVDWIPWIELVKQKHEALRALRYGDAAPWQKYLTERECRFYDPHDRPLTQKLAVNVSVKKNREGLKDRLFRGMAVDKQRGEASRGETPHFWAVIRDFRRDASSQLVWEGKIQLIEDVDALRAEYGVIAAPWPGESHVLIDSGWDTTEVYRICAKYGYTALKGEDRSFYSHETEQPDGTLLKVRRIYSPIQLVDPFEGDKEGRAGQYQIPLILYSKQGIADRLAWLQSRGRSVNEEWNEELENAFGKDSSAVKFWDVPSDVSEDYRRHSESEEIQEHVIGRTQEVVQLWTRVNKRNDLLVCERYLALLAEMAGLLSSGLPEPK